MFGGSSRDGNAIFLCGVRNVEEVHDGRTRCKAELVDLA